MSQLIIWTYDWVPEGPRGFVRDLRLRMTERPAFRRAHAAQMTHFAAADAARA